MIGLVLCDRCRRRLSVKGVVGPHRIVRLCAECLEVWRELRDLIYGEEEECRRLTLKTALLC
jgi:hypothetical protein